MCRFSPVPQCFGARDSPPVRGRRRRTSVPIGSRKSSGGSRKRNLRLHRLKNCCPNRSHERVLPVSLVIWLRQQPVEEPSVQLARTKIGVPQDPPEQRHVCLD